MFSRIAHRGICLLLAIVAPMLVASATASEFLIIPIPQKPKNVVTVAESGAQFNDLREALASISDASAQNPYIVYVLPGTYTIEDTPLQMKEHVSIIGSGRDETFVVRQVGTGTALADSSLVRGADNASIQHMTLRNDGGGFYSRTIVNENASPALYDLDVLAFGGQINLAINNFGYSSPRITNVFAKAQFGHTATAISDGGYEGSTIIDTQAVAEGATDRNVGIEVSAATFIRHTEASAIGGSERCRGMWLTSSDADIESVTLSATGPDECYGLYAIEADAPNPLRYSTVSGSTAGVVKAEVILSTTSNYNLGSLQASCISSIDPGGAPLDTSCRPQALP
ncbi:MAG: hypothetical protein KDI88_05190 [Gammaproteobacteria bacterium]|nr:hypothetical protein [Gammaproteobacteria bacterium]